MTKLVYYVLFYMYKNVLAGDFGPGTWQIFYIKGCEVPNPKFELNVSQRKLNRTHDVVSGHLNFRADLDDNYGIRLEICKECDGGCKPCNVLSDFNILDFVNKYVKGNIEACLKNSGIEPPELPLKKGEYDIAEYAYDYEEIPENGPYGSYIGQAFVLDNLQNKVGCLELHAEFKADEED